MTAAVIVHIDFIGAEDPESFSEFLELVESSGAIVTDTVTAKRTAPDAKYFIGSGKLEDIRQAVQLHHASLVLFNHALTPAQERNLERVLDCRVLDRTGLILDIFAQHARTHEGKLQVELAQLQHLSTRLIRGWTHLERQKGGIGLRGPGETQLETDRRLIGQRIKQIKKRLEKVKKQRAQNRQRRLRSRIPTVSLVGYTNAGKSTLFNRLTASKVLVADQLFATLDPTLRRVDLKGFGPIMLSDTVGFIRHLPHDLVESFSATLEEVHDADLLLHVVDVSNEERQEHIEQVNDVLAQIGAEKRPQLMIYNKIDRLGDAIAHIDYGEKQQPARVWLSALTGEGTELLAEAIAERLVSPFVHYCLRLKPDEGALRAKFYKIEAVISEQHAENGDILLEVRVGQFESPIA